jgi:hypothetical protein
MGANYINFSFEKSLFAPNACGVGARMKKSHRIPKLHLSSRRILV